MGRWWHKLTAVGAASVVSSCLGCTSWCNSLSTTEPVPPPAGEIRGQAENPLWVPLGPRAYSLVFEKVLDVVSSYFDIRYSNRYDGAHTIETFPRVAPGLERFWEPGDPDFRGRLFATLQSVRHRCEVKIDTAPDGGFFITVIVYKELEDLPRPIRATAGAAAFRTDVTMEHQYEVVDQTTYEGNWIPLGRDAKLEQAILAKIRKEL